MTINLSLKKHIRFRKTKCKWSDFKEKSTFTQFPLKCLLITFIIFCIQKWFANDSHCRIKHLIAPVIFIIVFHPWWTSLVLFFFFTLFLSIRATSFHSNTCEGKKKAQRSFFFNNKPVECFIIFHKKVPYCYPFISIVMIIKKLERK